MKIQLLLIVIASTMLYAFSCEKEEQIHQNTFEGLWYLEEILFSDSIVKPEHEYKDEGKYELIFQNDSTFRMDFTDNQGGGRYMLFSSDSLKITSYTNLTEVCCDSEFDEILRQTMKSITNYDSTSANQLVLFNSNLSILFKRN